MKRNKIKYIKLNIKQLFYFLIDFLQKIKLK